MYSYMNIHFDPPRVFCALAKIFAMHRDHDAPPLLAPTMLNVNVSIDLSAHSPLRHEERFIMGNSSNKKSTNVLKSVLLLCCIIALISNTTILQGISSQNWEKSDVRQGISSHRYQKREELSATNRASNIGEDDSKSPWPIIDAVFTFVNGSDPEFIAQHKQYGVTIDPSRVRDIGQLRYAMRSAFLNVPYLRNFIVVVSSKQTQTPSWLNTTHPRVRVVEHKEIWDNTSQLPSMNSNAIEWATMNIPDLSTLYLYFNDDLAVQTKLDLSSIWPGPDSYVLWTAWEAPVMESQAKDEFGKALAFVRKLYDRKYGRKKLRRVASHVPMLFDRAVLKKIKNDFPKEFEDMYRQNPFRTNHDMQFQFAYQQYIRHHFPHEIDAKGHLHYVEITTNLRNNAITFADIKRTPRQFLCLQDGLGYRKPSRQVLDQVDEFYKDLFPMRAPWEKAD